MSRVYECCKVFVRSLGCPSNLADGEFMVGCLQDAGFDIVDIPSEADVLIFNTCAVKTPTENRIIEILKKVANLRNKRLIVAGCLPLVNFERLKAEVKFDGILAPANSNNIVDAVKRVLSNEQIVWLQRSAQVKPFLDLPKHPLNRIISIVPVSYGCLGSCAYCCVVFARGRLQSCGLEEIVKRVGRDLVNGAREVWLTGQDMACYGRDLGLKLPDLLRAVCEMNEEFWIRVGMMTPNLVMDMRPKLIESFMNDHVFKFVHLPVQSGDDNVLKSMNRFYTVEDFRRVVDEFRKAMPHVTIATDVICGFPGESAMAFENSLSLIEDVKPDIVNVSKFFPRPRTAAEKMSPKVSALEVKERSERIASVVKRISSEKSSEWMNWEGRILLDEYGKQPKSLIGRNFAYKPIVIKTENQSLLGTFVNVRVTKTFQTYLEAKIID